MPIIDLRSDTVTQPSAAMRKAMAEAEVGDDVYGEDPSVNQLQERAADLLGMEAALFAPTGTQSNLLGLIAHCERGDEYIVGQQAHTYKYEGGGAAVLGSIQPQPLEFEADGTLDLYKVACAIKEDDFHFARTRLLCLENTLAGRALPMDYLPKAAQFCKDHKLKLHLDGARICNAAVHHGVKLIDISRYFDSVSLCLSKGLGAPMGSVLCGNQELIDKARRWRKVLGGGMRQVGIMAAAGLMALEQNVKRLAEDHDNARLLFKGLREIEELNLQDDALQTCMVFLDLPKGTGDGLKQTLKEQGILISGRDRIRMVVHMDVDRAGIEKVVGATKAYFAGI